MDMSEAERWKGVADACRQAMHAATQHVPRDAYAREVLRWADGCWAHHQRWLSEQEDRKRFPDRWARVDEVRAEKRRQVVDEGLRQLREARRG